MPRLGRSHPQSTIIRQPTQWEAVSSVNFAAPTQDLVLSQIAPAVSVGATSTAGVQVLTLTQIAPVVGAGVTTDAAVQNLTLSQIAPAVSAGVTHTAPVQNLILSQIVPSISVGATVQTVPLVLVLSTVPVVVTTVADSVYVLATTQDLSLSIGVWWGKAIQQDTTTGQIAWEKWHIPVAGKVN